MDLGKDGRDVSVKKQIAARLGREVEEHFGWDVGSQEELEHVSTRSRGCET